MKCPRCEQENRPQAKFCLECAAPPALRQLRNPGATGRQVLFRVRDAGRTFDAGFPRRMGRVSEGLALIQGVSEEPRPQAYQVSPEALSSEAYLLAGRISEAGSQARQLLTRVRETGQRASEADALHLGAEIAARTEPLEADAVEEQYRAAMAL